MKAEEFLKLATDGTEAGEVIKDNYLTEAIVKLLNSYADIKVKRKKLKAVKIQNDELVFDDGTRLLSNHDPDCCETHYLDFADLEISDFYGLEFDLTGDSFFNRVGDYGIELKPINGHSVKVPGYGFNNGYYSSSIDLIVADINGNTIKSYDVSECQLHNNY